MAKKELTFEEELRERATIKKQPLYWIDPEINPAEPDVTEDDPFTAIFENWDEIKPKIYLDPEAEEPSPNEKSFEEEFPELWKRVSTTQRDRFTGSTGKHCKPREQDGQSYTPRKEKRQYEDRKSKK